MVEASDEIFFVFDPHSLQFNYVNDAFEHFSRRNASELYQTPRLFLELIHPEDRTHILKQLGKLLEDKVNSVLDFRILRDDGVERWVRLKVCPILRRGKVSYLSGILVDDSARKLGIFIMQSVNSWKDTTLEILAHELTGPMGVVIELSKAVAGKLPKESSNEAREWLLIIEEICSRNLKLVQNIIKRESLQSVQTIANMERFELVEEIRQVVDIYKRSPLNEHRKFIYTHSHDELYANVDGMKYLQIINNLLSNAVKFTSDGNTIRIHLEQLEKTFLLTVSDDGIGIPKELRPMIFDKYTTAGRRGTDGQASVGLGMWIIKNYVEVHNGSVWLESEVGVGTKIFVELPL